MALTFDDGPAYTYTEQILDILARYDVTATFFVIGRHGAAQRELLRRVADEGHSVQNHSWDHYHLTRYSDAFVEDQLVRTNRLIEEVTGTAPALPAAPVRVGERPGARRRRRPGHGHGHVGCEPFGLGAPGRRVGRLHGAARHRRR